MAAAILHLTADGCRWRGDCSAPVRVFPFGSYLAVTSRLHLPLSAEVALWLGRHRLGVGVRLGTGDSGRVRERLGSLCAELSRWASLDRIIRGAGAEPELDELLTAIGGEGLDPERARVLLDAIEEACKRGGLDVLPRGSGLRPLPPGTSLSSGGESWVCPRACCDRVVLAEEADVPPVCAAAGGMPMKRWVLP